MTGPRVIWAGGSLIGEPALLAGACAAGAIVLRRCVDAADLLAAASLEPSAVVVLTPSVARIDAELVARIASGARTVIGLAASEQDVQVLTSWQVGCIVASDEPEAIGPALESGARAAAGGVWSANGGERVARASEAEPVAPLLAVWGPPGAPGRSRTALGMADELARGGASCCLIDGDLTAPSLDVDLGVTEQAGGLLQASRQADRGLLSPEGLRAIARPVRPRLSLLAGLPAPLGSADIRPAAMRGVLAAARRSFAVVVVDLGSCALERPMPKPAVADHDGQDVSEVILQQASALVAVARDTPLGLTRLVRAWRPTPAPALIALVAGRHPRQGIAALREAGLTAPVEVISVEERWERAGRTGATLAELAPRARARAAYRRLAERAMSGSLG